MQIGVALAMVFLTAAPLAANENPFREAPPEVEEALRGRVTEFYTLFQQRKYRKAEALVAEDSRDFFYESSKKPILGFEISSIEFDQGFHKAKVLVSVMTMMPMMGPKPLALPLGGTWK